MELRRFNVPGTQYAHFNECTNRRYKNNPCLTNSWHCTMIDQSAIAIGPYPGKNRRFLIGCRLLKACSVNNYKRVIDMHIILVRVVRSIQNSIK
jgi:hypothetical protein